MTMAVLLQLCAASIVAAVLGYFFGESNGENRKAGEVNEASAEHRFLQSTATHVDYAGPFGTVSFRRDELAQLLSTEITPDGFPVLATTEMTEYPKVLRVGMSIVAGQGCLTVAIP